jgi:type IV pilus assembly protein PilC
MPTFNYRARDNTGKLVKGLMEQDSKEEVAEKLQQMGYAVLVINEEKTGVKLENLSQNFQRISKQDIVMFNIQLANMLNSGLSIMTSLDTLQKQIENKRFGQVIGAVSRSVETGMTFSQALAMHPRVFSHLFVSMVKAGEASGNLDTVLARYAEFAEAQADLQQKVQGALFYPIVLAIAAVLIVVFIITSVIPKFVEIFTRAGITLPLLTTILYNIGMIIRQFWYLIILGGISVVLVMTRYVRTETGKLRFDRMTLKLPVVGSLIRKTCISRFARTLSTLVASGVPILQSLAIVREVVNNEVLARIIQQMHNAVEKGEKIAYTLKISEEFPADTVQMISVGEESGNLEGMLNKISDFYDRAIGYSIKRLTTVLEPLFLIVMGVMVASIMASMLLPMFDMMKLLRR